MGAIIGALMRWLLGAFTRLFGLMSANMLATKIILTSVFVLLLPVVLNNLIYSLLETAMATVQAHAGSMDGDINPVISFVGTAGYFAQELGFVSAISIIMSAMFVRFTLSFIPFVGPK